MTQIAELRKNPRPADTGPDAQPPSLNELPSTHASPYVLKVLGLPSAGTDPEKP